eukprot:6214839-Pleurochrysis_carterae.AAC.3
MEAEHEALQSHRSQAQRLQVHALPMLQQQYLTRAPELRLPRQPSQLVATRQRSRRFAPLPPLLE